ncbi:MAG: transporter substrate-binding domain-containing protein [Treponema sp.]|nr:transporter substrate-binding domain-containing protein [Treponema sp.]
MKHYIHPKWVKSILFSLIIFLLFLTSGYAEENKTVRIVCSVMDTSSTGYKSGYSYEYYQRIAYLTGWKYEYVYADFSTALQMLKNGEVDIKDNLSYTDERAEFISFPEYPQGKEVYYLFTSINNQDSLQEKLENLNGKKVAVSKGSFQEKAFKKWLAQHNLNVEIVETTGSSATFDALNKGEVSGIVYPGTNDARGYVPIANIGNSDFYFGVNKNRPDILDELNEALRRIQTANPSFNDDLYNKYESFDVASLILTEEEHEYANNLQEIKVGILDDYLPFSTEEKGEVLGVITYIADCIKEMTSGSHNLQITYKTYPTYLQMIQGLNNKEVNLVFPVTSDFYYAELNQILESVEVFELPMSFIYRDYNENVTSKIAVTKHSPSQRIYVNNNYPDSEIIEFDGPEECFEAVLDGRATSTIFNSFRAEYFFNTTKFWTLNEISLPQHASMCFAVNKEDRTFLSILNNQILRIDTNELINRTYDYLKVMNTYTAEDFIREHRGIFFFGSLIIIFSVIIILVNSIIRERKHKEALTNSLFMETKHVLARLAIDEAMESGSWEMEFDNEGNFLNCHWSDQFRRLLGYTDENDFPDKIESWSDLIVPEDKEYALQVLFDSAIDTIGSKGYNLEHRLITKDRGVRWFRAGGKAVKKVGEDIIIYYGAFQDINEIKLAHEKAYSDSINDSLTGLKNRRAHDAFVAELEKGEKPFICVISIDLNGLKTVNDEYGHAAGDELIFGAGECLSKAFEGIGSVYRMGGDEFEVLSTDSNVDFDSAIGNLKQICKNWHGTFVEELTMSIGVASGENVDSLLFDELIKTADERMYEDKRLFYEQTGRNRRKQR